MCFSKKYGTRLRILKKIDNGKENYQNLRVIIIVVKMNKFEYILVFHMANIILIRYVYNFI